MNVEKFDLVEEKLRRLLAEHARLREENRCLKVENEMLLARQDEVRKKVDGLLARLGDIE